MDKTGNTTFQFRIEGRLLSDFKLACAKNQIKPSEALRSAMKQYVGKNENRVEILDEEIMVNTEMRDEKKLSIAEMYCGPGGIGLGEKSKHLRGVQ